ncbi:MAG: electron transport complex subunit E [Oligosphaeraceae bacterium]|nr:electron transport complex subunit E [Oligosphaeraceae bacterium]
MSLFKVFKNGLWQENPVFVLMLGMCPTLAVTSSAKNALGMGIATSLVLAGSNFVVSCCRKFIPDQVRIPCYIVIIAAFVTMVEQLMQAYAPPELNQTLGIFIPLIVVNCIVLGRAEAFASKNGSIASCLDGLGMGLGFTIALLILGGLRELIADGSLFELQLIENWQGIYLFKTATGAFFTLGFILAVRNHHKAKRRRKEGLGYEPPKEPICLSCNICKLGK